VWPTVPVPVVSFANRAVACLQPVRGWNAVWTVVGAFVVPAMRTTMSAATDNVNTFHGAAMGSAVMAKSVTPVPWTVAFVVVTAGVLRRTMRIVPLVPLTVPVSFAVKRARTALVSSRPVKGWCVVVTVAEAGVVSVGMARFVTRVCSTVCQFQIAPTGCVVFQQGCLKWDAKRTPVTQTKALFTILT